MLDAPSGASSQVWNVAPLAANGNPLPVVCSSAKVAYQVHLGSAFYQTYFGMNDFESAANFPDVAARADGMWMHPLGWDAMCAGVPPCSPLGDGGTCQTRLTACATPSPQQQDIANAFAGKSVFLEGDMGDPVNHEVLHSASATAAGFVPATRLAFVDSLNESNTANGKWQARVQTNLGDAGNPEPIQTGPIYAGWTLMVYPNLFNDTNVFIADRKDWVQASYLSSADSPVNIFSTSGPGLQIATMELLDWTHGQGKPFGMLLSPDWSQSQFIAYTRKTMQIMEDNGCTADFVSVENYGLIDGGAGEQADVPNTPDVDAGQPLNTIAGAAYYLLEHRDGVPGDLQERRRRAARNHSSAARPAPTSSWFRRGLEHPLDDQQQQPLARLRPRPRSPVERRARPHLHC